MQRKLRLIMFFGMVFLAAPLGARGQTNLKEDDRPNEDPAARERYWHMMRADERGEIRPNALVEAKAQMDQLRNAQMGQFKKGFQRAPQDAGIGGWEWLGPGNIGGRIRSILIHPTNPNTMWVGSVSGGIWRSDYGGAWWYPVNDFMANLAITSLAMDPTDYSVMYAATGEGFTAGQPGSRGAGIFKSTDGGVSWLQLPSTASWIYVNRIAHHPTQPNTLLATVNDGSSSTVQLTTDGGTNWLTTLTAPATDVKYHPTSPNRVMVGAAPGVFTSTNGGLNWRQQDTIGASKLPPNAGRSEVAFAPSDPLTYYVSMALNGGEVWRSTDGGLTWTRQNTGFNYLSQGAYANAIWVDPFNRDIVVRGGHGASRSTDGGSTWPDDISPVHEDVHVFVNHPGYDGSTNLTVYLGDDGGLNSTQNIRTVQRFGWNILNNNLGITQFWGGSAAPDGSIIAGGTQDNRTLRYTPVGGTNGWFNPPTANPDGGFAAVNYNNPSLVFGEGPNLRIERSNDGGQTYTYKTNGLADAVTAAVFVAPFILDPLTPTTLYAGGASIWQTNDNADHWSQIRPPLGDGEQCSAIAAIVPGNTPYMWVGYNGGRVSVGTYWGGSWSWTDVGGGVLPSKSVTDIAINPSNFFEAIVTFGGYDTNNVYRTPDLGNTWGKIRGVWPFSLPAIQVNTVQYNPGNPNWIYVGTDLGVLASEDKGVHWSSLPAYGSNEGPANVAVTELFWQGSEYLLAATYGRGVFRTRILPGVYVDINNFGPQLGTQQYPFRQIQDAINTGASGSNIIINPGNYPQHPLTFYKRGRVLAPSGNVVIH